MTPIFFDLCNWKVDLPSTEMGKTEGRRGCEGRKQVKRIIFTHVESEMIIKHPIEILSRQLCI